MTTTTGLTGLAGELQRLDATAQAELARRGEVTPVELVEAAIDRIERLNPALNAVVTPAFDLALDAARAARRRPLRRGAVPAQGPGGGVGRGALHRGLGVPRATYVSRYDQELVVRLRRAGLVILGKTSTPEFGMLPTCEPALFGPTRNPWDLARTTSGSSGGSAAAVAAAWCRWPTPTTSAARSASPPPAAGCSASSRPGPATRSVPSTATSLGRHGRRARADPVGARQRRPARRHRRARPGRPLPGTAAAAAVPPRGRRRPRPAADRLVAPRRPTACRCIPTAWRPCDDAAAALRRPRPRAGRTATCPA